MADSSPKKAPAIPDWQQKFHSSSKEEASAPDQSAPQQPASLPTSTPTSAPELPLLEQAQKFLDDESIRDAPRARKVAFLEKKGLQGDDIEKLLGPDEASISSTSELPTELKTVHDSSESPSARDRDIPTPKPVSEPPQLATVAPKREITPIITYPEFLLKPQKPPPLVTFERLANATYALAGISALTYSVSKYLVQPMIESLTEARHDLAETTKADLETLNSKLETTVSHIPYIASSGILQRQKELQDEDAASIDSDPTELFHRDIATQTSPARSRSMSFSDPSDSLTRDPTTSQASRLQSLHLTLSTLLTSTESHFSQDRLKDQLGEFHAEVDKLNATYNPFHINYGNTFTNYTSASADDKGKNKKDVEATKFRNEIRALKGAFLSSRNFPTARPAVPFTLPSR